MLKRHPIAEGSVINEHDCYIEVIYQSLQTIHFENAKDFTISDADRIESYSSAPAPSVQSIKNLYQKIPT